MKDLIIKTDREIEFPEDVKQIQGVLAENGYKATPSQCVELWEKYSDSMCAGWMSLDCYTNEDVFNCISPYIE
jgi:hypothetical protein